MRYSAPTVDDYEELASQIREGFCFNTHHAKGPQITHWIGVEFEDGEISYQSLCKNCARANKKTVDTFRIRCRGAMAELPSLAIRTAYVDTLPSSPRSTPSSSPTSSSSSSPLLSSREMTTQWPKIANVQNPEPKVAPKPVVVAQSVGQKIRDEPKGKGKETLTENIRMSSGSSKPKESTGTQKPEKVTPIEIRKETFAEEILRIKRGYGIKDETTKATKVEAVEVEIVEIKAVVPAETKDKKSETTDETNKGPVDSGLSKSQIKRQKQKEARLARASSVKVSEQKPTAETNKVKEQILPALPNEKTEHETVEKVAKPIEESLSDLDKIIAENMLKRAMETLEALRVAERRKAEEAAEILRQIKEVSEVVMPPTIEKAMDVVRRTEETSKVEIPIETESAVRRTEEALEIPVESPRTPNILYRSPRRKSEPYPEGEDEVPESYKRTEDRDRREDQEWNHLAVIIHPTMSKNARGAIEEDCREFLVNNVDYYILYDDKDESYRLKQKRKFEVDSWFTTAYGRQIAQMDEWNDAPCTWDEIEVEMPLQRTIYEKKEELAEVKAGKSREEPMEEITTAGVEEYVIKVTSSPCPIPRVFLPRHRSSEKTQKSPNEAQKPVKPPVEKKAIPIPRAMPIWFSLCIRTSRKE
ncbi:uncharacterized protein EDB91DRAFT_1078973 [Suillus paluster]|uniref:uncharacterized protein n=1 Tax=Suillus paluster TaxID=48578 RepID=UPI001B860504|nr:uncharacterized protein EDB91DRAFT_1078973 [Suillus paluster]KAG1748827.1 hypothetical protein EDB91DRAFT_1078973 [Suillus paluster]